MDSPDVLVVAHFSGSAEGSNSRFRELARILSHRGAAVEMVTSSFLHDAKKQRVPESADQKEMFSTTYIDEPGYPKNICFRRLWSHRIFARNIALYLRERPVPDVIYCALPSNAVAAAVSRYAKKHGVRLILDVQDLWPEAFEMVLKPRPLARFALTPLRWSANRIYRRADHVVTVSDTYSERVKDARESGVSTTYLGTNLEVFDGYRENPWDRNDDRLQVAYIGTLGHSYNLPVVFDALRILKKQGEKVVLHVMGTGPFEEQWKDDTQDLRKEVIFHGKLAYPDMVSRLKSCDIAVNPIVPGAAGSIINKVCDYAASGLPVVNTQECAEYRRMLDDFKAGVNVESAPEAVASALNRLVEDAKLRETLGVGARRLAEEKFDRSVTYKKLAQLVLR